MGVSELVAPNALGFFAPEPFAGGLLRWSRCAASFFVGSDQPFRAVHVECGTGGGPRDRALVVSLTRPLSSDSDCVEVG